MAEDEHRPASQSQSRSGQRSSPQLLQRMCRSRARLVERVDWPKQYPKRTMGEQLPIRSLRSAATLSFRRIASVCVHSAQSCVIQHTMQQCNGSSMRRQQPRIGVTFSTGSEPSLRAIRHRPKLSLHWGKRRSAVTAAGHSRRTKGN